MKRINDEACQRYGALRLYIKEIPLGPMPGFAHSIPRCIVNIRIPVGALNDEALLAMALEQRNRVVSFGKDYVAMAFFFWTEEQEAEKKIAREPAVASVEYAPRAKWEDVLTASIGDYSQHQFRVDFNNTDPKKQVVEPPK